MAIGTTTKTKTDLQLQRHVQDELQWEPSIDAAEIGVMVNEGIVTLTGYVDNYYQKRAAERAVRRVSGVRGVAEEIEVRFPSAFRKRTDTEIAEAVVNALRSHIALPPDRIKVKVESGWVTLDGQLDWHYQKRLTEDAVEGLAGVRGVTNNTTIKPTMTATQVKSKIENSFKRQAMLDARDVQVEVQGSKVILRGSVPTWRERSESEQAAWAAPGVSEVRNEIAIL